jgi:beta-phosphoglucomutase
MSLLRGVILDVDGVLVLSEPFIAEAAMTLFAEKGYGVDEEEFRPFIGAGEDRFIGGVAEARGIPLDPDRDKAHLYEIYLELIRGRLRPVPGARDFIARCRSAGLRLAAASGADRVKVDGNLRAGGFSRELFEIVIDGTLVTRKKPAPEIFLLAAEGLHLSAEQCLVVEDAVNGVLAAKASGARCLALTTSFAASELAKAGADWTASDLANPPAATLEW